MLGSDVSTNKPGGMASSVRQGVRKKMEQAADAGFAEAWDKAPSGATNTLKHSGKEPIWIGNSLLWGFTAPYAEDVETGQEPHLIPLDEMPDLELWASRVLGDERLAWPVRKSIAREGTRPQPYVAHGITRQRQELEQSDVTELIDDEF